MENNESNLKSQQTGGLKLMTVFIAVLALHVVVIGGFTVYHLMSGGSTDADLVTDKAHKGVKVSPEGSIASDGQLPDGDKSTTPSTASATTAATPAPDTVASTEPSTTIAPATTPAPSTPVTTPAPEATASVPSGPVQSGPVITPPQTTPSASATTSAPEIASESATAPVILDAEAPGTPYVVKSHDSLARIAHQHHVTVAKLRAANSLKSDLLQIGQKLTIPAKTTAVASTTTPSTPAPRITPEGNTTILGDSTPAPAPKAIVSTPHDQAIVAAPVSGRHMYTVIKGDTLTKIARKFHTSTNALMAANDISDARKMKIGQKLKIPSQEPRSANVAPAPAQQPAQPDRIEPRATPSAQLANFTL